MLEKFLGVQEQNTPAKMEVLSQMKSQVSVLRDILSTGRNLYEFGKLLHEAWLLKRSISPEISDSQIDCWYEKARSAGAMGGKFLGADGGGGFLLSFVEPQNQAGLARARGDLFPMKFGFDQAGSRITYYDQTLTRIGLAVSRIVRNQRSTSRLNIRL